MTAVVSPSTFALTLSALLVGREPIDRASPSMSPDSSTLIDTFFGALQGTISVLLTLLAGYVMAKRGYLDRRTVRSITKQCTTLFLPCLIIEEMGPHLTKGKLSDVWIIPVWAFVSTALAHLIGWVGVRLFRLPYWTIVACGRTNSNALPLLLLQSLEKTGVLDTLAQQGESMSETLGRAKSLILLNSIVQQTFTFELGPSIMALDKSKDGAEVDSEGQTTLGSERGRLPVVVQDPERVGLLDDHDGREELEEPERTWHEQRRAREALSDITDVPDLHWPRALRPFERPVKKVASFMQPTLVATIIALILGIVPPLHTAFLDEDGPLYVSITQAVVNLGELFVALQTFAVGAELAVLPSTNPGLLATSWVLLVRFVVMTAISVLFVWATAGRGFYVDDRMVWFILILAPVGPSAMLLGSVAEMVDVDQGPIAGYLTVAYLASPLMAAVCSIGLEVVDNAASRAGL
ncbi:auxin efflux carrier [Trametes punicea]|nr:auxin efflux carrier [Trametes punicea]